MAELLEVSDAVKERFWSKVDKTDSCWTWTASKVGGGYGSWKFDGVGMVAHRFSYQTLVGIIPKDLVLDHLCRNKTCVNPEHLEPVTDRENILRGEGTAAVNAKRTECKNGHEFTEENTYLYKPNGKGRQKRGCLKCRRENARKGNAKRRAR